MGQIFERGSILEEWALRGHEGCLGRGGRGGGAGVGLLSPVPVKLLPQLLAPGLLLSGKLMEVLEVLLLV